MISLAVIDYQMGNIDSVVRALEECGGNPRIVRDISELQKADKIILPGVGAFTKGMQNIESQGFVDLLTDEVLKKGKPFLGICLGMQLLAESGTEGEDTKGLGWIQGSVKQLESNSREWRVPHVGWNEVHYVRNSPLFDQIVPGKDFYFTHSFHFLCQNEEDILAQTPHEKEFVSAIGRGNIFGVQFHPEKSQFPGFQLLKNFIAF